MVITAVRGRGEDLIAFATVRALFRGFSNWVFSRDAGLGRGHRGGAWYGDQALCPVVGGRPGRRGAGPTGSRPQTPGSSCIMQYKQILRHEWRKTKSGDACARATRRVQLVRATLVPVEGAGGGGGSRRWRWWKHMFLIFGSLPDGFLHPPASNRAHLPSSSPHLPPLRCSLSGRRT